MSNEGLEGLVAAWWFVMGVLALSFLAVKLSRMRRARELRDLRTSFERAKRFDRAEP